MAVGAKSTQAWKEGQLAPPWRAHVGMLLVGWGAFNLVEATIDHEILGIHRVRDDLGGPIGWDLDFLAVGLTLVAVGLALTANSARPRLDPLPDPEQTRPRKLRGLAGELHRTNRVE